MIVKNQTKHVGLNVANRLGKIGGSTIGAVAGAEGFVTPYSVYCGYKGIKLEDRTFKDSIRLNDGHILEKAAAEMFTARTGIKLNEVEFAYGDADHPEFILHPDREFTLNGELYGVEIKAANTNSVRSHWQDDDLETEATVIGNIPVFADTSLPDQYYCQAQWYYAMNNYKAVFEVRLTDNDLTVYYVKSSPDFQQMLYDSALDFIKKVNDGWVPDAIDNEEAKLKYPRATVGKVITANDDLIAHIVNYKIAKEDESRAKKQKENYETVIKETIKDAEIIKDINGNKLGTYKNTTRSIIDSDRLKIEKPDIYVEYKKESTSRSLRIS